MWPQGKQEDAEEFLGCVLGGLHEEMVAAQTAVGQGGGRERGEEGEGEGEGSEGGGEGEEGEWEQVGPKNKSTITRQVSSEFRTHPPTCEELSENTHSSKLQLVCVNRAAIATTFDLLPEELIGDISSPSPWQHFLCLPYRRPSMSLQ